MKFSLEWIFLIESIKMWEGSKLDASLLEALKFKIISCNSLVRSELKILRLSMP
jgi:hypothetical protein